MDFSEGRGRKGAKLEAHRRYIDIQLCLSGSEWMGWESSALCAGRSLGYDAAKDLEFFGGEPALLFPVPPGHFAVFFPSDAHAPLAGEGPTRKVVLKVEVRMELS